MSDRGADADPRAHARRHRRAARSSWRGATPARPATRSSTRRSRASSATTRSCSRRRTPRCPTQRELAAHFEASRTPPACRSILYNYPARAGVEIGFDCLDAWPTIPTSSPSRSPAATSPGSLHLRRPLRRPAHDHVRLGRPGGRLLRLGCARWLAGTANVLPRHHVVIMDAANERRPRPRAVPPVRGTPAVDAATWRAGSYNQKAKLGLAHQGLDCGQVRPPLLPLRPPTRAELTAALDARAGRRARARPDARRSTRRPRLEVHAEGEQGTCYLGCVFDVPGATMREKLRLPQRGRRLDPAVPLPRAARPAAVQRQPRLPVARIRGAHAGFVILQADRAHAMSGSNTICVVTALLETGTIADDRAGRPSRAGDGRRAVPRHGDLPGRPLRAGDVRRRRRRSSRRSTCRCTCPASATISVDVAYGGCYYVFADAGAVRREAQPRAVPGDVVEAAHCDLAGRPRRRITVQHPEIPEIDFISYVMLIGDDDPANGSLRGATVLSGRVDRSPCGTGNSARLALHGRPRPGRGRQPFIATSLIDSEFTVEMIGATPSAIARPCCPDHRHGLGGRHPHRFGRPNRSVPARLRAVRPVGHVRLNGG